MKIFAIESSCDETSVSVCENGNIISNIIATQEIHKMYGGVIPEIASRLHLQHILPVTEQALLKSNCRLHEIDAFAFAQKPGLLGSLLVGACFAKSLALFYDKPLIAVNHVHAHVTSNFINNTQLAFPFLCLTVSGGHTQIVLCSNINSFEIIGTTLDDAAGEAFDKSAKLLGLPYPGGVLIDKFAKQGDPTKFKFPHPKIPNFDYSFSGLKTAILYFVKENTLKNPQFTNQHLADICASIQHTIITILLDKFFKAANLYNIKVLCLSGGVSANSQLRKRFIQQCILKKYEYHIPDFEFCTDNAAMIAMNAYFKYLNQDFVGLDVVPLASI